MEGQDWIKAGFCGADTSPTHAGWRAVQNSRSWSCWALPSACSFQAAYSLNSDFLVCFCLSFFPCLLRSAAQERLLVFFNLISYIALLPDLGTAWIIMDFLILFGFGVWGIRPQKLRNMEFHAVVVVLVSHYQIRKLPLLHSLLSWLLSYWILKNKTKLKNTAWNIQKAWDF